MSAETFALTMLVGAAMLAAWGHVRAGRFAPSDIRTAMIHLGASLVVCQIVSPTVASLLTGTGNPVLRLVAVLGVLLPALVYALLAFIWLIVQVQGTLRNGMMR